MDDTQRPPDVDPGLKAAREYLLDWSDNNFKNANTYIVLFASIGYAGLFALWADVQHYLTYEERMTTGGFLGLSLLVFVLWHLYAVNLMARQTLRIARYAEEAQTSGDITGLATRFKAQNAKMQTRLLRWLPVVAGLASALGVVGAIPLVLACFEHLAAGR